MKSITGEQEVDSSETGSGSLRTGCTCRMYRKWIQDAQEVALRMDRKWVFHGQEVDPRMDRKWVPE